MRQQLQHATSILLVVAVVLQTLTLLARPELGNLPALACAFLASVLHLVAGFVRGTRKARASQVPATSSSLLEALTQQRTHLLANIIELLLGVADGRHLAPDRGGPGGITTVAHDHMHMQLADHIAQGCDVHLAAQRQVAQYQGILLQTRIESEHGKPPY
ncbi:hypothetical protein WR25_15207 [Diploscapter pachys]|uniref:Uncharacterized protein n=1 Tax=Diploscapter pachys TaxID=2018661 RepID=A0A2A2KD06_9BILA|nr:hypothetical protein WR25_15207 [Diploscapter pachys]